MELNSESEDFDCNGGNKNGCINLWNALDQKLNIVKKCKNSNNPGCLPTYKSLVEAEKDANPDISAEESNATKANCPAMFPQYWNNSVVRYLADGSLFFTYPYGVLGGVDSQIVYIDVNGIKPPNKWGHDLFGTEISDNKFWPSTGCMRVEKSGVLPLEALRKF